MTTVTEERVEIDAAGNWTLIGALFQATQSGAVQSAPLAPVILMSSAAGVPQTYYTSFARYLVEQGARAVLTYDYRGMSKSAGDSKRWKELRMFHWGQLDFPAAAGFLKSRFPDAPLVGMGHSYGGQALGLSGIADQFDCYATVATMSGYWQGLDTPYRVWFLTQIIAKALVATLGYVPKGWGLGEAFPGPIMGDWIRWINDRNYWFDDPDVPGLENFSRVTLPYLSIGVGDDPWGTKRAIDSFMAHYSNADFQQVWVEPSASGSIGHIGYFRQRHKECHWPVARDFLLAR